MITERTIINALIIGASLIVMPFLVSEALSIDYIPALVIGGLGVLIFALFYIKDKLSAWPLICIAAGGGLNFIPFSLDLSSIFCILLIIYYAAAYIVLKQRRFKLGYPSFFWPILILISIIVYHNHTLAVHALGADNEGGRPAIVIYITCIAYFCGINMKSPSVSFLSKIPFYYVVAAIISNIPNLLSIIYPRLTPYLYYFTSNVDTEVYFNSIAPESSATGDDFSRLGALAQIGSATQLYLLCQYPIVTWFRPGRWWILAISIGCCFCAIASGYRNVMLTYCLTFMVCSWCYYSWRVIVLPYAVCVIALMFLVAANNDLIKLPVSRLPMVAQRTLSFLPLDWNRDALDSAESSNEFRQDIIDVYIKEYMLKSPYIGNGFTIDTGKFNAYSDMLLLGQGDDLRYIQAKTFIEGKMFHTGWVSVYDAVGIVGSFAFVFLGWSETRIAINFAFSKGSDRHSSLFPLYVWLVANLSVNMIAFFVVFGDFGISFKLLLLYGIVVSHLRDIAKSPTEAIALSKHGNLTAAGT